MHFNNRKADSAPCENSWLISLRQLYEGGANRQNTWWLAFDRMHCVLMGHSRRGNVSQLPDHGFMQRLGQRWDLHIQCHGKLYGYHGHLKRGRRIGY